jgi:hypothetical protein
MDTAETAVTVVMTMKHLLARFRLPQAVLIWGVFAASCTATGIATSSQTPLPTVAAGTAPAGACVPTERQPFAGGLPGYPATALIGGDLAYLGQAQWRTDTDEKAPWLWRTEPHTKRLVLRAERLDASRTALTFDLGPAQESPDGSRFAPEWGGNLLYGGYVGLGGPKLPEPGCWRLSIVSGSSSDAITIRVVPKT